MAGTMSKAELLSRIEAERAHWQELVAEVGVARMEEPGPMGRWTFKDLAAHLTGWRERTIARLEAAGRGEPDPPPPWPVALTGDDEINDWIQDEGTRRPLAAILGEADASYRRLAAAVAALPEEDVTRPDRFPWMADTALASGDLFGHLREEHEPDIRRWLADRAD